MSIEIKKAYFFPAIITKIFFFIKQKNKKAPSSRLNLTEPQFTLSHMALLFSFHRDHAQLLQQGQLINDRPMFNTFSGSIITNDVYFFTPGYFLIKMATKTKPAAKTEKIVRNKCQRFQGISKRIRISFKALLDALLRSNTSS